MSSAETSVGHSMKLALEKPKIGRQILESESVIQNLNLIISVFRLLFRKQHIQVGEFLFNLEVS